MYSLESQTVIDADLTRAGRRCPRCGGQMLRSFTASRTLSDWDIEPSCLQCGYQEVVVDTGVLQEVKLREENRLRRTGPRRKGG